MTIPVLIRFSTIIILESFAAVPSAFPQMVHLNFSDGGFANKGTLGGAAEERQAAEGDKDSSYLPMNGALADFRLYERALKPDEVLQLSQQCKP